MINNQDISGVGAWLLSQRAAPHQKQQAQMRKPRSRNKAAYNLTEEGLLACGVRVKKNGDTDFNTKNYKKNSVISIRTLQFYS